MIAWHRDCAEQESNGNELSNVISGMKVQNRNLIADRYLLQGALWQNGPVQLFDGLDAQLQRFVTVQILSEEGAQDRSLSDLFLRHQQIASDIHHCSVFAVYDAGKWEGRPFSVMERNTGSPALSVYGGSDTPVDVEHALAITRQAAEALQCCRDAGLSDWAFSPDAVRIDAQGNARLALLEGFQSTDGSAISSRPATDPAALGALLRTMLQGSPNPAANATATVQPLLPPPAPVMTLLGRMSSGKEAGLPSAEEVAQAISTLESALAQTTQAYDSPVASAVESGPRVISSGEVYRGAADAPTLAAVALPALSPGATLPDAAYAPPADATNATNATNATDATVDRGKRIPLVALGALLLASVLLVALLPRLFGGATSAAPTKRLTPSIVAAPDLRGKSLDDARKAAGDAGLNLAQSDAIHNATYPVDTVAGQLPNPGTQIQANSLITVSLSIGPEATPTPTPRPPAPTAAPRPPAQPTAVPPPPNPSRNNDGKKDKGNNGKKNDR